MSVKKRVFWKKEMRRSSCLERVRESEVGDRKSEREESGDSENKKRKKKSEHIREVEEIKGRKLRKIVGNSR